LAAFFTPAQQALSEPFEIGLSDTPDTSNTLTPQIYRHALNLSRMQRERLEKKARKGTLRADLMRFDFYLS
jgi:hypothetical protein